MKVLIVNLLLGQTELKQVYVNFRLMCHLRSHEIDSLGGWMRQTMRLFHVSGYCVRFLPLLVRFLVPALYSSRVRKV